MSQFDADSYFNKIKTRNIDMGEQRIRSMDTRTTEEKIAAIKKARDEKIAALEGMAARKAQETGFSSFGAGANRMMEAFGTAYGMATGDMDNWAREQGKSGAEYWEDRKPMEQRLMEEQRANAIEGEDTQFGKAIAAVEGTIDNGLLGSFAAEQVPNLIPGGVVGRGAGLIAKVAGASAKVAGTAATAAGVATGAVQQGADIGGGVYDDLLKLDDQTWAEMPEFQKLSQLVGPEKAKETIALTQGRKATGAAGLASVLTNLLPGGATLERALAGAAKPGLGVLVGIAKGAIGEAGQEALEEGSGAVIGNVSKQAVDTSVGTFEGVGEAAGLGALGGGLLGGPVGGVEQIGESVKKSIEAGQKADAEGKARAEAMNAALETGVVDSLPVEDQAKVLVKRAAQESLSPEERTAAETQFAAVLDKQRKLVAAGDNTELDQQIAELKDMRTPDNAEAVDAMIADVESQRVVLTKEQQKAFEAEKKKLATMEALTEVADDQANVAFTDEVKTETLAKAKEGDTTAQETVVRQAMLNPSKFEADGDSLIELADSGKFNEQDTLFLRSLGQAQSKINSLKDMGTVSKEVLEGANGNIGMGQYLKQVAAAVRKGNVKGAQRLSKQLQDFSTSHRGKARAVAQAYSQAQRSGTTDPVYVVKTEAGGWEVKTEEPTNWDREDNGGLNIHRGSGKIVQLIKLESDTVAATLSAVQAMTTPEAATATTTEQTDSRPTPPPEDNTTETPVQESDTSTNNEQPESVDEPTWNTRESVAVREARQMKDAAKRHLSDLKGEKNPEVWNDARREYNYRVKMWHEAMDADIKAQQGKATVAENAAEIAAPEAENRVDALTKQLVALYDSNKGSVAWATQEQQDTENAILEELNSLLGEEAASDLVDSLDLLPADTAENEEDIPFDGPPPVEDPGFDDNYVPEDDGLDYDEEGNPIYDDRPDAEATGVAQPEPEPEASLEDRLTYLVHAQGEALDYAGNEETPSQKEQKILADYLSEVIAAIKAGEDFDSALKSLVSAHKDLPPRLSTMTVQDAAFEIQELWDSAPVGTAEQVAYDEAQDNFDEPVEEANGYLNLPTLAEDVERANGPLKAGLLRTSNLVAHYVKQRILTRGAPNGLLQVKDLMDNLFNEKGILNEKLLKQIVPKAELNDEQKKMLKIFWQYAKDSTPEVASAQQWIESNMRNWAKKMDHKSPIIIGDSVRHKNYMEYFRQKDADGNTLPYDQNLLTAIAYGAFSYIVENGGNKRNTEYTVRSMLGLKKEDSIPLSARRLFTDGTSQALVIQSLGKKIFQAAGFEMQPNSPPSEKIRLELALGSEALAVLQQQGLVEYHRVPRSVFEVSFDEDGNQVGDGAMLEENRPVEEDGIDRGIPFIRILTNSKTDYIVQNTKNTKGILNSVFSVEPDKRAPRDKPEAPVQKKISKTSQKVPPHAEKMAEKPNSQKWFTLPTMEQGMAAFTGDNLKKLVGWKDLSTVRMHKAEVIVHESKNNEVERDLQDLQDFRDSKSEGAFYFTNRMNQTQRNNLAEQLVNPQTSKIHRHAMAKADWESSFDTTDQGDLTHQAFLMAVGQALGVKTDKQRMVDSISKLNALMEEPQMVAAVAVANKINAGETITEEEQAQVIEAVGKHKLHGLQGLLEYARYKKTDGTFRTHLAYEVDGVSNGVALTLTMLGENYADIAPGFGMIPEGVDLNGFSGFRGMQGAQDIYERLASDVNNALIHLGFDAATLGPIYHFMGDLTNEDGEITSDSRDRVKYPLLMLMFGGSTKNNIRSMGMSVADSLTAKIEEHANNGLSEEEQLAAIHESINQYNHMVDYSGTGAAKLALPATTDAALELIPTDFQRKAVAQYFIMTFGTGVENAFEARFGSLEKTRREMNDATTIVYTRYKVIRDQLIKQYEQMRMDAGDLDYREISDEILDENGKKIGRTEKYKQALQSLDPRDMAEIENQLKELAPILETWMSQQGGTLEHGINLARQINKQADSRDMSRTQEVTVGNWIPDNAFDTSDTASGSYKKHARGYETTVGDPGVRTGVLSIHSLDSGISMETLAQFAGMNAHDAIMFSIAQVFDGANAFNKNTLRALIEYSPGLAVAEMMDRSNAAVAKMIEQDPTIGQLLDETMVGPGDYAKPLGEKEKTSQIRHFAWKAEVRKLQFLLSLKTMDQYSLDGGEYQITADDKKAIKKRLTKARKELAKYPLLKYSKKKGWHNAETGQEVEPVGEARRAPVEPTNVDTPWGRVRPNGETGSHNPIIREYLEGTNPTTRGLLKVVMTQLQGIAKKDKTNIKPLMMYMALIHKLLQSGRADQVSLRYVRPNTPKSEYDLKYNDTLKVSSAWYSNEGNGVQQMSFRSPEFLASNLGAETVVHEMLHAVLQTALFKYQRSEDPTIPDPKRPTDPEERAKFDSVKDLEALLDAAREQTGSKAGEKYYGLTDVHELVSVGMTNIKFQEMLAGIDVGKIKPSFKQRFKNGAEFFFNTLNTILFGKEANKQTNEALEMLVGNVAVLLEAENDRYTEQGQRPSAMATSAQNFSSRQVFEALKGDPAVSPLEEQRLLDLLNNVVSRVYGDNPAIKAEALRVAPATAEEVYLNALKEGKAPFASKIATLFGMSQRQAYVAESVELALRESMNDSSVIQNEVRRLWTQAKAKITPAMLGQDKWDMIFTPERNEDGTSNFLSQFMAASLTYRPLHDALMEIQAGKVEGAYRGSSFADQVKLLFARLLQHLGRVISRVRPNESTTSALNTMAGRMAQIEKRYMSTLDRAQDRPGVIMDAMDSMAKKSSDKLRKAVGKQADKLRESTNNVYVGALAGLSGTVLGERTEQFWDFLMGVRDNMHENRYGLTASIINEMRGVRDITKIAHKLLDDMNGIEQARKRMSEVTSAHIQKLYGRELNQVEEQAITRSVIKTDLAALVDAGYSMQQIADMVGNLGKLNAEIQKLESQLSGNQFEDYYLTAGKALGHYMATGEVTVDHLMLNASNIVYMAGTEHQGKVDEQGPEFLATLDPLVSLYALKSLDGNFKTVAHKVMVEEMARGDANGIEGTVKMHSYMQRDAAENLFADDQYHMIKGYIKDIFDPHTEIVAATEAQGLQLEKAGYVEITGQTLRRDPADPSGEARKLYAVKNKGLSSHVIGFLSNTGKKAKGSELHSGVTSLTAVEYNRVNQRLNKQIAAIKKRGIDAMFSGGKQFNPAALGKDQKNRMVPVLNGAGQAVNYRYVMSEKTKIDVLGSDGRVSKVMGATAGNTLDKKQAPAANKRGIDAIRAQYLESYADEPGAFVRVGPDSQDTEVRERYQTLPDETRAYIKEVWGEESMLVRKDTYDLAFGYRKYSLYDAFEKQPSDRNFMEKILVSLLGQVEVDQPDGTVKKIGSKAALNMLRAENVWQEVVTAIKDIVVIKNLWTFLGNESSNLTLLMLAGVPITSIIKNKVVAYQSTIQYQKDAREKMEIEFQLNSEYLGGKSKKELENRIVELDDSMNRNPVKVLVDAGMFQTLVEDIAAEDDPYSYKSKLTKVVDKYTGADSKNMVVRGARTVAKVGLMTHDTTLYKVLNQGTILGDFTSRYVLHTHTVQKEMKRREAKGYKPGDKEYKDDERIVEDSLMWARAAFVNYDVPTHKAIQYLNDTGLLWFSKYYLRIQAVILKLVKDNPLGALSLLGLDALVGGVSDILDSSMWGKSPLNLGVGAIQYPFTLDELLTAQAVGL